MTILTSPINTTADRVAADGYAHLRDHYLPCLKRGDGRCPLPESVDLTDLPATIDRLIDSERLVELFGRPLAEGLGEAKMAEIRGRIETALAGELPPEVMQALRAGPEQLDRLTNVVRDKLPGAQLAAAKEKVLGMTVLTLPNPVYGSMLAGSAAHHFAQVICGPYCVNLYELKRGKEVVEVLVWQLKNREAIQLSLGQLIALGHYAGQQLGIPPIGEWGRFGKDVTTLGDRLKRIEGHIQEVDRRFFKVTDLVDSKMREAITAIEGALKELQAELTRPVRDFLAATDAAAQQTRDFSKGLLPDGFDGIPRDWEDLKSSARLPDALLGQWGEQTPLELLGMIAPHEHMPALHPSLENPFDPVLLHNGEFYHRIVDVTIPARGIDLQFERIYRSRHAFVGPMGHRWSHSYHERLLRGVDGSGDWIWFDAAGRKWRFSVAADGTFRSPRGVFSTLHASGEGWLLRHPDGGETEFTTDGFLRLRRDPFGNAVRCHYDANARLVAIEDAVGRRLQLRYDLHHRIAELIDWSQRRWRYDYNSAGDLTGVTTPATDHFPKGKTTRYLYRDHQLTQIIDSKGEDYLRNVYGTDGLARDRVVAQYYGQQVRPLRADYVLLRVGWLSSNADAVLRVTVTDRAGSVREYDHNRWGELVRESLHDGARIVLRRASRYDDEGRRVGVTMPGPRQVEMHYAEAEGDRHEGGNLHALVETGRAGGRREWQWSYQVGRDRVVSTRDPLGGITAWSYEGARLTGHTDAIGDATTVVMNAFGEPTQMTSPDGYATTYAYTPTGELAQMVRDAEGVRASTQYAYDTVGNLVGTTDPEGHATRFVVNARNQVVRRIDPDQSERRYAYDANDNVTRFEVGSPSDGFAVTDMTYDALDHLVEKREKVADAHWITTRYRYDPNERLTGVQSPEGSWEAYRYDPLGRVASVRFGAAAMVPPWFAAAISRWVFHYDAAGALRAVVSPLGARTQYIADELGQIVDQYDPLGHRLHLTRDVAGHVTGRQWFDAPGESLLAAERYDRDPVGRLTVRHRATWKDTPTEAQWVTEQFAYDRGQLATYRDPAGATWQMTYGPLGHLATVTNPLGHVTEWHRDHRGLVTSQQRLVDGATEQWSYDALGRQTQWIGPEGETRTYRYDSRSHLIAEGDATGIHVRHAYDLLGRQIRHMEIASIPESNPANPDGRIETELTWSDDDQLVVLGDDLGHVTRYRYDPRGHVVGIVYPSGEGDDYAYDLEGRLIRKTDANGTEHAYDYDVAGRYVGMRAMPKDEPAEILTQQFRYDGLHRVTEARQTFRGATVLNTMEYSPLSQLLHETTNAIGTSYAYDARGLMTERRWDRGPHEARAYDPLGRLIRATADDVTVTRTYDDAKRSVETAWPGGLRLIQRHDRSDRREETRAVWMGDVLWQHLHAYDAQGNLLRTEEGEGRHWTYQYDGADRLIEASFVNGAETRRWQWALDGLGQEHGVGMPHLTYDAYGNLTSAASQQYTYDPLHRLLRVTTGHNATVMGQYAYDALGRRIRSDDQEWHYSGWHAIARRDGQRDAYWLRGDQVDENFGELTGQRWYLQDRLGSVRQVVREGETRPTMMAYTPYGEPLSMPRSQAAFGYTGRPYDADTGLLHARHRMYQPATGRFLTPDPLGYQIPLHASRTQTGNGSRYHGDRGSGPGGPARSAASWEPSMRAPSMVELHRTRYARNNPLRYRDPDGRQITMVRDGQRLQIGVTVEISGDAIPPSFPRQVAAGLRQWGGLFPVFHDPAIPSWATPQWSVEVLPDVIVRQGAPDWTRHQIAIADHLRRDSIAYVMGLGGSSMYVDRTQMDDYFPTDEGVARMIAHEAGHWFGLDDQYFTWGSKRSLPRPGFDENIMGCSNYRCRVGGNGVDDIGAIFDNYERGRLNKRHHNPARYVPYKG